MAPRRTRIGLDTSCVIPLLCDWHEFHAPTIATIGTESLKHVVICRHVLLECFAVLTRLPTPYRVPPRQAEHLLTTNFSESVLCGLLDGDLWAVLDRAAERQVGGGKIYDAVIADSTARAGASVLLTWNVKDFLAVAPAGLEIRSP
ncbi:MAG: PIN domain-containing protein [Bryobacterales bacterium]